MSSETIFMYRTMAGMYDIVDEDAQESEWTHSAAKAFLEELVANGRDQEDGKKIRANVLGDRLLPTL